MSLARKSIAGGIFASAMVLMIPTAAEAAIYSAPNVSSGGTVRAQANFNQTGDLYKIIDRAADGKSGILFKSDRQSSAFYAVTTGSGTSRTIDASLPNGSSVNFRACFGESSNVTAATCAASRYVTA